MARVFVFTPFFSTTFPDFHEMSDHLSRYGANIIAYDNSVMMYYMIGFDQENDTYRTWADMKDRDEPIKIGEVGKWWLFS